MAYNSSDQLTLARWFLEPSNSTHRQYEAPRATPRQIITRYTGRNGIEDSLGSGVNFFHLDCLASEVPLYADLDAALTVLANGCYRWLASELHGFAVSKPKRVCRKIIETGGTVRITDDHIHVHFHKRAHNPILRQAALDTKAGAIPWAGGKTLRFTYAGTHLRDRKSVSRFPPAKIGVQRNLEAGIRLRSPKIGQELTRHFDTMISCGHLQPLRMP
jgi:hypothetical protein